MVVASRKHIRYLLAHSRVIWSNYPLRHVLYQPYLAWRSTKLEIELFEFEISFEEWKALKSQFFVNFLQELTALLSIPYHTLVVFRYVSSNSHNSGVKVILENNYGLMIEVWMRFKFPVTNNQVEYEAMMARITLAEKVRGIMPQITDKFLISCLSNQR